MERLLCWFGYHNYKIARKDYIDDKLIKVRLDCIYCGKASVAK